jgi:hypothetical protein
MDRAKLIRAHFDAYDALIWAKDLEPKFLAEGVQGAELEDCRQSWTHYTEGRDWEWWQEHVKQFSDGELQDEIQECITETNAIVLKRQEKKEQNHLREILNRAPTERDTQQKPSSREDDRER